MVIQWLLRSKRLTLRQQKIRRQIMMAIGLGCIWGGLVFPLMSNPEAIAQTPPSPMQTSEVDRLTKTCFQLLQQANYPPLVATCTEAVEQARAIGDRTAETYARINLASAYGALGQYPKAIDQAEQSLQLAQDLGDRQAETYALINLGNAHQSIGQNDQAIEASERSLQITRSLEGANGPSTALRQSEAYTLINLGSAYWSLGQYANAIAYSEQSLQLTRELGDLRGEACSLINLASAYGALENYPQAIQYAEASVQLTQATGNRRGEALALNNLGYALYGNGQLTEAETYLRQSVSLSESLRPTLLDTEKLSLFETLTNPYSTLQSVLVAQGKITDALEIAEQGRARALADRLAQRGGATAANPITLVEIQQVAREQKATLVEYAMANDQPQGAITAADHLYIWVVSPSGNITFRSVDLSGLTDSLGQLVSAANPRLTKGRATSAVSLRQLYQVLIAPIQALLPTNPDDQVVFLPHGSLFLAPFAALQASDGSYLIEHHTLRTAPSIQVLQLTYRPLQPQAVETALVVGNPTDDLPAAAKEAKIIARRFNTRPLLGKRATKAEVVKQMPQANLIHLAAHAAPNELDENYGGLIVFADPHQGFSNLTTQEILDMQLQAELVVLSGCSTGVSDIINSDGVVGLARSMMTAGVPSVLMSLWPVADAPTADLMQAFYQHWRPTPPDRTHGLGLLAAMGLFSVGVSLYKPLRRLDNPGFGHRSHRFTAFTILTVVLVLVIGLSQPTQPTAPALDKAQALRQAMLTTLQTHPDPQDWAAFTLMGQAR
jgi:CHAT domain-containing protein